MKTLSKAFESRNEEFVLPDSLKELSEKEYVGVDLDGTQAHYTNWKGLEHIGEPIPRMVSYVKFLLENNIQVVHFTARVASADPDKVLLAKQFIDDWSMKVYGRALPITAVKDRFMAAYYDDKAYNVRINEGLWIPHE